MSAITVTDLLKLLHLGLCLAICLRVMFFRRPGTTYRWGASLLAYLIVLAAAWAALGGLLNIFTPLPAPSLGDLFLLVVLTLVIYSCRGNVMRMFYSGHDDQTEHPICRIIGGC